MDRLADKNISEEDLREFQEALDETPDAKREYMDTLYTEASLEFEAQAAVLPEQAVHTPHLHVIQPVHSSFSWRRWALPAAACLALLLGLSYLLGSKNAATSADTAVVIHVATITDTNKTADAAGLRIGGLLGTGDISIPDGAEIGIAMHGGARLDINGPATFHIDGPEKIFLHNGRVQAYAPEYARGFTIDTAEGKIIDLGTRFVTATGTTLGTEIHVIEGLVEAQASNDSNTSLIAGERAAILKDGKMTDTDYLAQRLTIPLNPNLVDSDGDGVPDAIEIHYGTSPNDPDSIPDLLRVEESFAGYQPGAIDGKTFRGKGDIPRWKGGGMLLQDGLQYQSKGISLRSSGGCFQSTGEFGVSADLLLSNKELPDQGVIYISFLMQQPANQHTDPYSGLLLYHKDYQEQFFLGELSVARSYGSRFAARHEQDSFAIPTDDKVHLFVIRIDRTRLLTDVFVDPPLGPLGKLDADIAPQRRYQNVPQFDRIILRSGSRSGKFPVRFDELRVGLSWDSVLPVE